MNITEISKNNIEQISKSINLPKWFVELVNDFDIVLNNKNNKSQLIDYGNKVARLFNNYSPTAHHVLNRKFFSRNVEVLPDINTLDPRFENFLVDLVSELNDKFSVSEVKNGILDERAIPSDFNSVRTKSGTVRTPLSFGIDKKDKESILDYRNFDHIDPAFSQFKVFLNGLDYNSASKAKVKKKTNTGAPTFDHNQDLVINDCDKAINNMDDLINLVKNKDFKQILIKYNICFLNHTQIRLQNDSWKDGQPKQRDLYEFDYTYGLKKTKSKSNFKYYEGSLATCRTRTVIAGPKRVNLIISALMEPIRKSIETEFKKTWKENDIEHLENVVSKNPNIFGLDIKQYDNNLNIFYCVKVLDCLPLTDDFKYFIMFTLMTPVYCPDVDGNGTSMSSQDPLDIKFLQWNGLQSGHALTSLFGKYPVVIDIYSILANHGFIQGTLEEFLKHELSVKLLNMSDDNLILCDSPDTLAKLKEVFSNLSGDDTKMKYEIEDTTKFLGVIFYRNTENEIKASYDLVSMASKFFVPERDIVNKLKKFGVYGRLSSLRPDMYGRHPLFKEFLNTITNKFSQHFGLDLVKHLENNLELPIGAESLKDIEVLLSPEKLDYKYEPEEIAKNIVEEVFFEVPDEWNEILKSRFFRKDK